MPKSLSPTQRRIIVGLPLTLWVLALLFWSQVLGRPFDPLVIWVGLAVVAVVMFMLDRKLPR